MSGELVPVSDAFQAARIEATHAWALELDALEPAVRDATVRAALLAERRMLRLVVFGEAGS